MQVLAVSLWLLLLLGCNGGPGMHHGGRGLHGCPPGSASRRAPIPTGGYTRLANQAVPLPSNFERGEDHTATGQVPTQLQRQGCLQAHFDGSLPAYMISNFVASYGGRQHPTAITMCAAEVRPGQNSSLLPARRWGWTAARSNSLISLASFAALAVTELHQLAVWGALVGIGSCPILVALVQVVVVESWLMHQERHRCTL